MMMWKQLSIFFFFFSILTNCVLRKRNNDGEKAQLLGMKAKNTSIYTMHDYNNDSL